MDNYAVWIGELEVMPRYGCDLLGNAEGAYVNALAYARSCQSFVAAVTEAADRMGLNVIDVEDPEPLSERVRVYVVDQVIIDLGNRVLKGHGVEFSTFHCYFK